LDDHYIPPVGWVALWNISQLTSVTSDVVVWPRRKVQARYAVKQAAQGACCFLLGCGSLRVHDRRTSPNASGSIPVNCDAESCVCAFRYPRVAFPKFLLMLTAQVPVLPTVQRYRKRKHRTSRLSGSHYLLHVRELLGSNLGPDTGCPDVLCIYSVLPGTCW
jgi:hypothetical protein